jgi:tetratricopeptide (TPR) repeat protein
MVRSGRDEVPLLEAYAEIRAGQKAFPWRGDFYYMEGQLLTREGLSERALVAYEKAEHAPVPFRREALYMARAIALEDLGRIDEAIEAFDVVMVHMERPKVSVQNYLHYARILRQGGPDQAKKAIAALMFLKTRSLGEEIDIDWDLAGAFSSFGRFGEAAEIYREVIARTPNNHHAHLGLIRNYSYGGRYLEALEASEHRIVQALRPRTDGDGRRTWIRIESYLVQALVGLGRDQEALDRALAAARHPVEAEADRGAAVGALAFALSATGETDKALELLRTRGDGTTESQAVVLCRDGRWAEALPLLQQVDDGSVLHDALISKALWESGERRAAETRLERLREHYRRRIEAESWPVAGRAALVLEVLWVAEGAEKAGPLILQAAEQYPQEVRLQALRERAATALGAD